MNRAHWITVLISALVLPLKAGALDLEISVVGDPTKKVVVIELPDGTAVETKTETGGKFIAYVDTQSWREKLQVVAKDQQNQSEEKLRVAIYAPQEPSPRNVLINDCGSRAYDEELLTQLEKNTSSTSIRLLANAYCHGKAASNYFAESSRKALKRRAAKIWFDASYALATKSDGLYELDSQAATVYSAFVLGDGERRKIEQYALDAELTIFKDYNIIDKLVIENRCPAARKIVVELTRRLELAKSNGQTPVIHGVTLASLDQKQEYIERNCSFKPN